ncbi:Dimodular nonribosomal peptide synthase [Streptomyces lavendulae subsp. lavendulae]|uniref:Dimodular nonribosomal peptide synthase n=9 Tax=Streptomyces lavendulae TaxID=1914 RepID=A0A2K8PAG0_STRLA|nr:non-ribosomal peptide synthetase [Streptomyces lavendulae]ATZ23716.1 Dimodular nonribosomal peptide synthase [Streptomyces lavendulae subsp. lavendulae]QUQ53548.1 Dimodular nonribosomal peptide synthase [Streptomyces lavendulae subsp. lavendulae]
MSSTASERSSAHGPAAVRLPLSAAQRDIWTAHALDATGSRYNIGEYRELVGPLDADLLARAWYQLAREADVLRVRGTGSDEDGGLWQLLHPDPGERRLRVVDLDAEPDPVAAGRAWMAAELARPFDLADDWLTRHVLLRAGRTEGGERRWFYFHAFHHLVVDGMGVALLDQRLVELYERGSAGEPWGPSPFGSLEALLAEDGAYRASPEGAADRAHWAAHLAGLPQTPRLGEGRTGRTAPGALPFVRRTVVLPAQRAERLREVARAHRTPWTMLVIALVAAYVHRVSGSPELVLGLPVTGRRTDLARRTPGMMSNVVPLRVAVPADGTTGELLAAVVAEARRGLKHQRTRYEDMCRDLGLGEAERRITAPLVNIMAFTPGMRFCGLPTLQHNLGNGPVEDLAVGVYDLGPEDGLRIDFDAAPEVCDVDAVAAHQDRFVRFVESVLSAGEQPLSRIELLGTAERRQVLDEWTGIRADTGKATLVERFEEQVRLRPTARALVFGGQELTYAELDARANRLAHHLAATGLGRGDLAGILLDRGPDFAVALLAVVKTGAGYALLDPEFPDERLAGTARDASLSTLVTDTRHHTRLPDTGGSPWVTVRVDTEADSIAARPTVPLEAPLTWDDVACVMFTSGSTGRPKGILSSHRNLVSTLTAQTYATFGPGETFLQCSPVSWDAFSLEFWGALLHGGTTVLQPGQRPEPALIAELSRRHRVTMLQLSSSLFNYLTDEHPDTFTTTRIVYTGGEPASPTHVHRLHGLRPHLTITNGYGPAESMGFTTTHTVAPTAEVQGPLPIGRPLTNKHAYVLDARLRPSPPGTTGELYLSGDGLAHGYLAQPTTTATHFIPNPYGPPGSRLYRTGDQAHWDTHGNLHYTGRTDTQIKIRGFRIEPTEIETTLTTHPHITQATLLHSDGQLTAYVTAAPGAPAPAPEALRAWLRERLPEHMVPARFAVLDRLPLTPNGKIDKAALPVVEAAPTAGGRAPRTETEELVRTLVSEVLGSPAPLSMDDGFFDHGGHSLLAARLTNRIASTLGVTLTLRDVFQHPTPAALTRRIEEAGDRPALPPLRRAAERPERLPLSFAQQRLWLVAGLGGPGATAYNVPMAVRLEGEPDVPALRAAFEDLAARHAPLRTRFATADGDPYQIVDPVPAPAFELRDVTPGSLEEELLAAARHSFDLTAEHPLRVTLLRSGEGAYTLLVLLHHIATDGQSLRPLFEDLSHAYAARLAGAAPDWEPLPADYADFALWQRTTLAGDPLETRLAHWRTALAGLPEELGLLPDRPRPPVAGQRGGAVRVDFGTDLYERVVELARAERCTPFMVLQAALAATLTRLGAGTDVPLGSPVAGRSDEALSGLVGFFVNTLVLRTDTSGNPAFRELLARVRSADLDAFAHQDAPFDLVLEALNPVRSLARHPLFQVCLALESGPGVSPVLPGLRAGEAEPLATGAVKFDLEFLLRADGASGLTGAVLYSSDLYERATVERMTGMLRRTLEQVAREPGVRLSELELLDGAGRRQVLEEWTGVRTDTAPATLVERFEEQVRLRPTARALVFGGQELTYAELDARANRLAHHLAATGLGRGDLAGILLDRGPDFAVALLAVVKTGAGYALLDPEFPDERLAGTARDASLTALVTDTRHHTRLPEGPWRSTLVDAGREEIADCSEEPLEVALTWDDVACVMFTSGSTGRPKGILSSHRNLVSTLTAQTYATFGPGETFLQCSPVSWDAFSLEFWGALLHGGTTVLQPGQRPEPALISALAQQHRVTMLQLSSSLFNYLTDEHPDTFTTTRIVYTGGEPASPTHVERLHGLHPRVTITNGYGPAESMGFTTTHTTDPNVPATGPLSIGRPLTNKHAYVLDAHLSPTPPGTTGELYLSGDGLAHGYLAQPTTTATHFIPNPYGPPGSRLYRTGDQAHWDTHGNLHYTGRTDTQIKIRGFRIEPTEIETTLTTHPHITQATLATHPDHHRTPQLTAYLVTTDEALSPQDVRLWLRTLLPDHMVPAFVVLLDRLPLTPNGKIDKSALPAPQAVTTAGGRAPRTPLEEKVRTWFGEALAAPSPLSIDDDFFDQGGHSLLAARLTNRIGTALGVTLTLRDVFQHPTPVTLARHIETRLLSAGAPAPRRARPALRRRTPDQERSSS